MTIKSKLVLASLLILLVPLLATHLIVHSHSRGTVTRDVLRHLESVAVVQEHRVENLLAQDLERLALVASRTQLRLSLKAYTEDPDVEHRQRMNRILLDARSSIPSFDHIHVMTLDGRVVASTDEAAIGSDRSGTETFAVGRSGKRADLLFVDEAGALGLHLAGPLRLDQEDLGVLVIRARPEALVSLVSDYSGLGRSGETVLAKRTANGDALYLTPLRFDDGAALRRTVPAGERSRPIIRALDGEVALAREAVDYRGEPVLAATRHIALAGWGLVVKMDRAEALASVRELFAFLLVVLAIALALVVLGSAFLARSIVRPVVGLTRMAARIGEGDLSRKADTGRADEIGRLGRELDEMAQKLRISQAALLDEISQHKRAQEALAHLNAVLTGVRDINQLITRGHDRDRLIRGACESLVATRGYCAAWIALLDEHHGLQTAAEAGLGEGFEPLRARLLAGAPPACVTRAIGERSIVVIADMAESCPGCPAAERHRGSRRLAAKLAYGGRVHGVLVAALPEGLSEDQRELGLFREVAGDIAFALHTMEVEKDHGRTTVALRESEDRYRDLTENMNDMVQSVAPDGSFLYVNRAWRETLGYSEEEARGLSLWDVVHPDEEAHCRELFDRVLGGENVRYIKTKFVAKGGRTVEVEGSANCRMAGGKPVATRGIYHDVTPRRQAEEARRESEEQYRDLVETTNDLVQSVAPDGTIVFVNRAWRETLGYTDEETRGMSIFDIIHPESHEHCVEVFGRVVAGEKVKDIEAEFVAKDSRKVTVEGSASCRTVDGKPVATYGIFHDVTQRRAAEQALRDSEEKYRNVVERANDGIVIIQDGAVRFANRRMVEMTGYDLGEVIGSDFLSYLDPEERPKVLDYYRRRMAGEKVPRGYESVLRHKSGCQVFVEINAGLTTYEDRPADLVFVRDVTERKQLEDQFRQSQKLEAVGRLAGGVAHDFNNMLGAIVGYSDIILRDLRKEDPIYRDIEQIKASADRAAGLTRQLLAFSRKQVLEPRVINLNSAVRGIEKMLRRLIGEDIELSTALADGLWHVKADAGQIEQVVMNLAVNSRDAMPTGGKITIETANVHLDEDYARDHVAVTPGAYVMLAVSDTGSGMDEETRSHLFEPFFTTKEQSKGTGLGLSTVYGIVKQSGGNIWVYSEPGKGATFKIYLPKVAADTEAIPIKMPEREPERGTETVLVAEDEAVLRRLISRILQLSGYRVIEAANGGEALLACQKHEGPVHLLVTDVVMPGMSGRELAEKLAEVRPGLRVIFTSGYTDNAIVHHGVLDAGAAFIQKPFTASALAAKVREVLDTPASQA